MKLYLKRNNVEEGIAFTVYSDTERIIFNVKSTVDSSLRMRIEGSAGETFSTIRLNTFMFTYFSVHCARRMYILVPCVRDQLAFAIYGSTYRFSGNLATGEFIMKNSDSNTIMTVRKEPSASGETFVLEMDDSENRAFMISAAVCAASYQVFAEPNTPQVCC